MDVVNPSPGVQAGDLVWVYYCWAWRPGRVVRLTPTKAQVEFLRNRTGDAKLKMFPQAECHPRRKGDVRHVPAQYGDEAPL
jgi:hypothetical protein